MYYVTDGQGQQFAVGDTIGNSALTDQGYRGGGKFGGGTRYATSFFSSRYSNQNMPTMSFFRNRLYDQASGRWTQEDPVGVAGGVNLYQFNGNNPVMFTDPFGLCPPELTGRPCTYPVNDKPFLRGSYDNPAVGDFGMVRDGGLRPHQGIDLVGTSYSLALAADAGEVTFVGRREGYGLMVEIGHRNDRGQLVSWTAYTHLSATSVNQGGRVSAGQQVGQLGRTGNVPADSPTHLHFEIRTQSMPGQGLGGRLDPTWQFPQLIRIP